MLVQVRHLSVDHPSCCWSFPLLTMPAKITRLVSASLTLARQWGRGSRMAWTSALPASHVSHNKLQ
eukprot:1696326-Pyramimonas_sp.AAC.1